MFLYLNKLRGLWEVSHPGVIDSFLPALAMCPPSVWLYRTPHGLGGFALSVSDARLFSVLVPSADWCHSWWLLKDDTLYPRHPFDWSVSKQPPNSIIPEDLLWVYQGNRQIIAQSWLGVTEQQDWGGGCVNPHWQKHHSGFSLCFDKITAARRSL